MLLVSFDCLLGSKSRLRVWSLVEAVESEGAKASVLVSQQNSR